ncbi:hypothetical protein BBP40_004002 [Aspergillus hancockii]|nr:hypothetical protein BBP40_004002 [Aspergillus hancockii]
MNKMSPTTSQSLREGVAKISLPGIFPTRMKRKANMPQKSYANKRQAIGTLVFIFPFVLHSVLQRHAQIALKCHYLLAVASTATLAYHLWRQQSVCFWYVIGAVGVWLFSSVASTLLLPFCKKRWGYAWPTLEIGTVQELLRLRINVPLHWNIHPGQYVQIWAPQIKLRYTLQFALFYVVFWEDAVDHRALYILIRPQSSGLTANLYRSITLHQGKHRALVMGPYGYQYDLSRFGTIVFVVEDVGFLRVLPYIRMLVQASQQRQAMVRKLEIFWQMEEFSNQRWVSDWMQQLLDIDRGEFKILQISVYYRRRTHLSRGPSDPDGRPRFHRGHLDPEQVAQVTQDQVGRRRGDPAVGGSRLCLSPGKLDPEQITQDHIDSRRGDLAIGVSSLNFHNVPPHYIFFFQIQVFLLDPFPLALSALRFTLLNIADDS